MPKKQSSAWMAISSGCIVGCKEMMLGSLWSTYSLESTNSIKSVSSGSVGWVGGGYMLVVVALPQQIVACCRGGDLDQRWILGIPGYFE
eukprot:14697710-Ditylum_brightwellii.AAC.1